MGLSSSKTKQTSDPSKFAKPYISSAAGALQDAYAAAQPTISAVSGTLGAQLPSFAAKAFGPNAQLDAATDYNTSVLGGKFLDEGNPYLQAQIDATNSGVRDRVAAQFSAAGRTGSGANQYALGKALSENETGLRYTDYSNERARMGQAASLAPSLDAAKYQGLGAYLQLANGAIGLPQQSAQAYAGGLGSLLGQYQTRTGTYTPSVMDSIGKALDIGSTIAGLGK
ncbi:hypothetical protein Q5H91_03575 [Sphingomonas sp. KR1UV-12]|uniref:Tail fiber domain-containing protein n=1 Tax=Sphingomonas aurea TaxID=3063994 RepID=A0ABT9EH28_9SPHN|nr:hypothetical protein [Sphingomonas sp. KR1UV-12]MDP1026280.1 hypothetical protein [Sphingomonas sp. KR1UV-12]